MQVNEVHSHKLISNKICLDNYPRLYHLSQSMTKLTKSCASSKDAAKSGHLTSLHWVHSSFCWLYCTLAHYLVIYEKEGT